MKFSINERYNGKKWKVLNNQQLKHPIQLINRVFKLFFLFSQLYKNGHSLFFLPCGQQLLLNGLEKRHQNKRFYPKILYVERKQMGENASTFEGFPQIGLSLVKRK